MKNVLARAFGSSTWWSPILYCVAAHLFKILGLPILPDPIEHPAVPIGIAGAVGLKEAARRFHAKA